MKNKYRIVADNYLGYEVQIKYWYWPFCWSQLNFCNTHATLEEAKRCIESHKVGNVFYEE